MPRVRRIYVDEGVFHILLRGNNGQWIYKDDGDFKVYRDILNRMKEEQPFKLYHYCLMNNHVHLILETNEKTKLSKLMKRVNLLYFYHYKRKYGYRGHFWQDRYKSLLIDSDEYLLACGLYIERNPVRAGIEKRAEEYKYSSYRYYVKGIDDGITDMDTYLCSGSLLKGSKSERQEWYRRLNLDEDLGISEKTFKQLYLGSKDFISRMEERFKIANTRLKKGRPRK